MVQVHQIHFSSSAMLVFEASRITEHEFTGLIIVLNDSHVYFYAIQFCGTCHAYICPDTKTTEPHLSTIGSTIDFRENTS